MFYDEENHQLIIFEGGSVVKIINDIYSLQEAQETYQRWLDENDDIIYPYEYGGPTR